MALTDAIIAGLAAHDPPVKAAVADRPKGVTNGPFVVLWPDAPVHGAHTLAAPNGKQTTTLVCHCAGLTPDAADIAQRALADVIYGLYSTTADGRKVEYPEQLGGLPMTRDDDVSPPLYDLAVEWRLRTSPIT